MTTEKEKLFKGPGYSRNKQEDNKDVVGAWFTHFWGKTCNLQIVDEIAATAHDCGHEEDFGHLKLPSHSGWTLDREVIASAL